MQSSLASFALLPSPDSSSRNSNGNAQASPSDADILSSGPLSESLSQQLDLWTTLRFQSDEPGPLPPAPSDDDDKHYSAFGGGDGLGGAGQGEAEEFDLDGFLTQFNAGVDPFAHTNIVLGLPNLNMPMSPIVASPLQSESPSLPPPAKRQRGRKASIVTRVTQSEESYDKDEEESASAGPLTPAEDKRRRNTAASARFRLKKKEREANMERNLKSLEQRVVELEREADGLRKENGWLRGLLVGANGVPGVVAGSADADGRGGRA